MKKIEISTILEDNDFIYNIETKKYHFKYDDRLYACFDGKEDRGYYNGKYDDTCYFSIENNENMIEFPSEYIKYLDINHDKETEKLKLTIYTSFETFIKTTFRYKTSLYEICNVKTDLECIKYDIEKSLSGINEIIDKLNNPY